MKRVLRWARTISIFVLGCVFSAGVLLSVQHGSLRSLTSIVFSPKKLTDFDGIALGMSMNEVRYVKGGADYFSGAFAEEIVDPFEFVESKELGKGKYQNKTAADFRNWVWRGDNCPLSLEFDRSTKAVVRIDFTDEVYADRCEINGIKLGDSEEYVYSRLGKDGQKKMLDGVLELEYKKYNMTIHLVKKKVNHIKISETN